MSKSSALVKNTLIIAVGKLSTQFLTFLLLPLYTAVLSPQAYGELDLIVLYAGLLASTLTVQMEMSVFRHLIDARGKGNKANSPIVSTSFAIALLGGLAGVVGIFIVGLVFDLALTPYIAGAFFTLIFVNYFLQVARGLGRNDLYAIGSIITGLTNIGLSVFALLALKTSIDGILGALIIANIIGAMFLVVKTGSFRLIRIGSVKRSATKDLIGYSWPLVPNHIAVWGINGISRTIVAVVLGFVATGIYAAANKFTMIYTSLYGIFAMSWTEAVALHLNKKDDFLSNTSNSMVKLFGSLALLIISASAVAFPWLVSEDFNEAKLYIPLLIIGGFFASLMTHYAAIYLAAKETMRIAKVTFQAVTISTMLTLAGVWFIGLWAPAIALIITYVFIAVRRHYDTQRLVKITYRPSTYIQLGLLTIFVVGMYYIGSGILNYVSAIITAGAATAINRREVVRILGMIRRRN